MKKHFLFSIVIVLLAFGKTSAQTYVPIATTGYSLDGVAENTTAVSTTGGAMDASDFVLYSQYYGTLYSTNAVGLPNNGLILSGLRTYQLQGYAGFNVMHILAGGRDTLEFVTPQPFPAISLLGFGTQGSATASITVRFTDNTTQVFTPITMDDWFTANPSIYNGFDRVLRTTGNPAYVGAAGNPRMFGIDLNILCANQGKFIKRVIIKNNSVSAHICVMAVAGNVPPYSLTANPSLLCTNATSTLTGIGLTSYTWEPVDNFAGSNSASISISPTVTTTYTLRGDNAGCPAYTTTTIYVSSVPPVLSLAGSSQTVCLGAPATITASGALAYTLSSPAANGGTFTPSATDTYTITGDNGCGTSSLTTTITVSPLLISASTPTTLICAGSQASLNASGGTSYTWMPGSGSLANFTVPQLVNTTYTVTGKTGNCIGTNTITISTSPVPTLNIASNNNPMCNGGSVNLSVNGNGATYTWTPGNQTGTSITISPLQTVLYAVTATNSNNCVASAVQVVTVNPNPTVTAVASNPTVCTGGASTLTATGATTYSWSTTAGTSSTSVSPLTNQTYTVTGSYTTGCHSTATVLVNIFSPTISISNDTSICLGAGLILTGGTAVSFTWSHGLPNLKSVLVTPTLTTVYTLTGSVSNPGNLKCPASNSVQVTVNPNPTITISANKTNSTICLGESIILTGAGTGAGGTYTWTGVPTSAAISPTVKVSPTANKIYYVTGKDVNGCEGSAQFSVKVIPCTGIENYEASTSALSIYPNPANGAIHIKAETALDLIITNELGQHVRSVKLNEANAYHVTIEDLSAGIYFVSSGSSFKQKIVILK